MGVRDDTMSTNMRWNSKFENFCFVYHFGCRLVKRVIKQIHEKYVSRFGYKNSCSSIFLWRINEWIFLKSSRIQADLVEVDGYIFSHFHSTWKWFPVKNFVLKDTHIPTYQNSIPLTTKNADRHATRKKTDALIPVTVRQIICMAPKLPEKLISYLCWNLVNDVLANVFSISLAENYLYWRLTASSFITVAPTPLPFCTPLVKCQRIFWKI